MHKHLMLVFTHPVSGAEQEYNRWYDEQHLADVTGLPGIVTGQRYVFDQASPNSESSAPPYPYLAVYEIPEGELGRAKAALAATSRQRRAAAPGETVRVPGSPALGPGNVTYWFTAIGEPVTSSADTD